MPPLAPPPIRAAINDAAIIGDAAFAAVSASTDYAAIIGDATIASTDHAAIRDLSGMDELRGGRHLVGEVVARRGNQH